MPKLFGVDLRAEIARQMGRGLLPLTLVQKVQGDRVPGQLSAGTNSMSVEYDCRGVLEERVVAARGDLPQHVDRKILVLAGTLPLGVEPAVDDELWAEGERHLVLAVSRDPAGATFSCRVALAG